MSFFDSISSSVSKAVDYVVDKNRKAALINRIRIVIKNERENTARAYVALGKYYFEHLRDAENEQTEHLCRAIEESDRRMRRAFNKLDEITAPADTDDDLCSDCNDDCDACPYYDDLDEDYKNKLSQKAEDDEEDDIAQKPFINEVHDEAAALEEQQTADSEFEKPAAPIAPAAAPILNVYASDDQEAEDDSHE